MIKALFALHHFPPNFTGGAELRAFRTALALQDRGHQVRVACVESMTDSTTGGVRWTDEIYQGLPVRRFFFDHASAPDPFLWQYHNPWIGDQIFAMLQEDRPDLLHLFSGYLISSSALEAAFRGAVPSVVSLTDFWFLCPRINLLRSNGQLKNGENDDATRRSPATCARCLGEEQRRYRIPGKIFPGLMDFFWQRQHARVQAVEQRNDMLLQRLNRVDALLSPSQFLRSVHIAAGVDASRILYTRQGVDSSTGGVTPPRAYTPPLRIGYIGQIASHKGVHVLIQAIRSLPGAPLSLTLYGDASKFPPYTRELQRLIAGDARIVMAPPYERTRLAEVYHGLDVVVVPSLWYENSPNVILEAFANRVPVIATNLGGMAELVEHDCSGLLFNPGDAQDLAQQILSLVEHPEKLEVLRENIPPVKTVNQEIDDLVSIYERVIQARSTETISAKF